MERGWLHEALIVTGKTKAKRMSLRGDCSGRRAGDAGQERLGDS